GCRSAADRAAPTAIADRRGAGSAANGAPPDPPHDPATRARRFALSAAADPGDSSAHRSRECHRLSGATRTWPEQESRKGVPAHHGAGAGDPQHLITFSADVHVASHSRAAFHWIGHAGAVTLPPVCAPLSRRAAVAD